MHNQAFARDTTTGAMTFSFIQAVESEPGTTYGRLLTAMRAAIRETGSSCQFSGPIASLIRRAIPFGSTQVNLIPIRCFSSSLSL